MGRGRKKGGCGWVCGTGLSFTSITYPPPHSSHQLTAHKNYMTFLEVHNIAAVSCSTNCVTLVFPLWECGTNLSLVISCIAGYNPVTRQNKTSCLRITSLLLSHHHLLIGTSTGVVLTLPLHSSQGTSPIPPPPLSHLPQGHVDSTSFLCQLQSRNSSLVLSGGTGYENFATSHTNQNIPEAASCLLIWRLIPQQDSPD